MCVCVYLGAFMLIYIYIYLCVCVCVCMCVFMCVCMGGQKGRIFSAFLFIFCSFSKSGQFGLKICVYVCVGGGEILNTGP